MKLVYPTLAYKEKAIEYMNEFYEYGSQINGAGGLNRFLKESTYEEWIEYVRSEMDIANLPEEKVPALT
ncbi:MAG: GNAT family N-acetyltransferase, partial [Clostridiales bacterium]|nr:GNAT family N-acetyltransferase [Clostridiales bacterium]